MRNVHKIVATGAFAGLAVTTAAASGAFACTPIATIALALAGTDVPPGPVAPGDSITVNGSNFYPNQPFDLTWQDPVDRSVQALPVQITATSPTGFTATIAVPDTARASATRPDNAGYYVVATQRSATTGEVLHTESAPLYIRTVGTQQPQQPQQSVTVPHPVASATKDGHSVTAGGGTKQAAPVTSPVGGVVPAAGSVRAPGASPQGQGTSPAPTGAVAAPSSASPAGAVAAGGFQQPTVDPATAPLPAGAPVPSEPEALPLAAPSNLWSGLDAGRAPSLLDAPAAAPSPGSGAPVGGLLLGGGLLALAAAAYGTSRRRLALSRRTPR